MRNYSSNIRINGWYVGDPFLPPALTGYEGLADPDGTYESEVAALLDGPIHGSQTGRVLLDEITQRSHKDVMISMSALLDFNASTTAGSAAFQASAFIPGAGAPATIGFNPRTWNGPDTNAGLDPSSLISPDSVLLHELLHALRQIQGLWLPTRMGNHFDNQEEFLAIMVANLYLSENGNTTRCIADHQRGFHPLLLTDSAAFANTYSPQLSRFKMDMSGRFWDGLCGVRCAFNPIRAYQAQYDRMFTPDLTPWTGGLTLSS
jgi:hypothetical protein